MNAKQFLFLLFFEVGILFVFAVLIAPLANKTAFESVFIMLQALAVSTSIIWILIGIALFACWVYDELEDKT